MGRSIFPCICSRWALTSAISPKSASTIRRSSERTSSSRARTGAWMSARVTRIAWVMSVRPVGDGPQPVGSGP